MQQENANAEWIKRKAKLARQRGMPTHFHIIQGCLFELLRTHQVFLDSSPLLQSLVNHARMPPGQQMYRYSKSIVAVASAQKSARGDLLERRQSGEREPPPLFLFYLWFGSQIDKSQCGTLFDCL